MIQGVISKSSFRRQLRGGKSSFTVMSLHINNNYAKKRVICKKLLLTNRAVMLDEQTELVAGDFNGAAWRRQTSNGNLSIIEEAFLPIQTYRCFLGPHPCGDQGQCRVLGQTFAGFSSPQTPMDAGKYVSTVHFPFPSKLWAFAQQWLLLKERSAPYQRSQERCKADEDESDRSLSSYVQATIRFRHNRPYVQRGSHEHN